MWLRNRIGRRPCDSPSYRARQVELAGIDRPLLLIIPPGIVHAYRNVGTEPFAMPEDSGALPTVLAHLADYLDARQALRQKTSLALLYPVLVGVVCLAALALVGLLFLLFDWGR